MPTFNLDLVTPDKVLFAGPVDQVDVPGVEGDFGVLAGHAPLVAMLKPGMLTVHEGGKKHYVVVMGGFAEVNAQGLTILADFAGIAAEFDRAVIATHIRESEHRMKDLVGALLDREIAKLDHFKQLDTHLQTTAAH